MSTIDPPAFVAASALSQPQGASASIRARLRRFRRASSLHAVALLAALLYCQAGQASLPDLGLLEETVEEAIEDALEIPSFRTPETTTFAAGLESPWGMAFLPDGRLLVTERPGRLRVVGANGGEVSPPIAGLPQILHGDHGGLLDVAIDPDFDSNRLVYFSYTKGERAADGKPGASRLAIARARLSEEADRIDGLEVLFRQTPMVAVDENLGGRLAVSPDGHLFLTIGDRFRREERIRAQDLAFHHGKTVRIRTDGSVPDDNPFIGLKNARPEIWSLGHRHPQGAFVHPRTGALWVAEHGPWGGDEVNLVRPGGNYGWPLVSFGCEYDSCDPIGESTSPDLDIDLEEPLAWWGRPSIAPSNLILYTGDQFPQWKDNVLVGALGGRALWRLELSGDDHAPQVTAREALFTEIGERIRNVRQGPDGALYLLTDGGEARIIRVAPSGGTSF